MDEQRIQDYWNLIQTLLNYPNGKKVSIVSVGWVRREQNDGK
ncbi:MAG: hypothetical protein RIM23_29610 [Coleofasciculus sp. G3-WIS-01]